MGLSTKDTSFLGALIQPIGNAMLERADSEHQQKLQAKKDRFGVILSALNSGELENPETAIDMLMADIGTGGKSKKQGGIATAIRSLVQGHGKRPAEAPVAAPAQGEQPWYVEGESAANIGGQANATPAAARQAVAPGLADVPTLKFTTPQQKADRARQAAEAQAEIDINKAREIGKTKRVTGPAVYLTGNRIPSDVAEDQDGQAIDKSENARYMVREFGDGRKEYIRVEDVKLSPQDRKIQLIVDQMKAADKASGVEPRTDDEYRNLALVEERVNAVNATKEKQARFQQFMKLSENQLRRGTQIYDQAKQLFPLTLAARELEPALAQARLDALQSRDAERIMQTATTMAAALSKTFVGPYANKKVTEVRDMLLSEWGEDPVALQAEVRGGQKRTANVTPPDDMKDPALRELAKQYLIANKLNPSNENIDGLLKIPANVAALKGGGS